MPISVTSPSARHNIRYASDNRNPGDRLNLRGALPGRAAGPIGRGDRVGASPVESEPGPAGIASGGHFW